MKKRALITGFTGQDGSYMAELLLNKNYDVFALVRRNSTPNNQRVGHLKDKVHICEGDLGDTASLQRTLFVSKPDEIFHLGAMSYVGASFDEPSVTANITGIGTTRLLEALLLNDMIKDVKFYNAGTSELYGNSLELPQNEETPMVPVNPYGAAKLYSYIVTKIYKGAYGLFGSNGILFNHESSRRGREFVSRKITWEASEVALGKRDVLRLGNLDAKRDWGYAPEYVDMMWRMLQHDKPEDFVIATGETHSVREFVEKAFDCLGFELFWEGKGVKEKGIHKNTGKVFVTADQDYYRPLELNVLCGDPSKAKKILGWEPKTKFEELVELMIRHDYNAIQKGGCLY